jgi:hypothetical protein
LNNKLANLLLDMKGTLLDLSDERWVAFASSQPQANIFHHPAWIRLLADSYGYHPFIITICNPDDQILAGLPMIEIRSRLSGQSWVSLPFTDHCWLLCSDPPSSEYLSSCLGNYYRERELHKLEMRCEFPILSDVQSNQLYVRHFINLCPDVEAVASRFHKTHLKNLKVAQKKGVRIERGSSQAHMDSFYRLQVLTRQRKGLPIQPRKFFELLTANLLENGLGFILLAYQGDVCLAGAVFLHWQQTLTYKYSASRPEGRNLCPGNLILSSAIRWGCENGYAVFDMGRTDLDNSGLRWFKKGWGAEEVPLCYSTLPPTVKHSGNDSLTMFIKTLIRKSPTWVCKFSGELFYKYLG